MSGPAKPDDPEITPEEMAALLKGLRKSAARNSDPDIVAQSDGREAAAYHAAPAPPPAAVDRTVPNGDVLLSSTLRREVALSLERRAEPEPRPASEPSRLEATVVPARRARTSDRAPAATATDRPARRTWAWIVAGVAAFGIGLVALFGAHHEEAPAAGRPASSSTPESSALPPAALAPSLSPSLAPSLAPPAAATPARAPSISSPATDAATAPSTSAASPPTGTPEHHTHHSSPSTASPPSPSGSPSAPPRQDVNRTF